MLITDLVKDRGHRQTETDRKLITGLQSYPAEAAFWSAEQLTAPLRLHQSAATRLSQRLGFERYPDLRDALRQDYLGVDGRFQRMKGRLERREHDSELRGLVTGEVAALEALAMHVTHAVSDILAERIEQAEVVHLFGQGNASVLVHHLS